MEYPYCTILTDGRPYRRYATKGAALLAAKRHHRLTGEGVEVAWCRDGTPKVWLAYVTALGVETTAYWEGEVT